MAVWPEGTEVIALYNFNGNPPEDISFRRGEIITIIAPTSDPNWYRARKASGQVGTFPANYVEPNPRPPTKLNQMLWFHGKISRDAATNILTAEAEDGCYLIRESSNFPGDYTLCVYYNKKVEHYHIVYKDNKLTIDEDSYFDDLHKLVKHYQDDSDGLVCSLKRALIKMQSNLTENPEKFFANSQWKIDIKDLKVGCLLGKGESGEVYKGNFNNQDVAIKVIKDGAMVPSFLEEASVMTTLKHENLVTLMGIVLGNPTYIVVEFMARGSLVDYLRTRGRLVIAQADQIKFACDACKGMTYLSQRDIVHRDLAARNILLNEKGTAKVADFGLALPENSRHAQTAGHATNKFPIKWTAPEAIKNNKDFTTKSDMWSFGILLWEIFSFGRVPYPRIPLADVLAHINRGYRMEPPEGCPPFIAGMMARAWEMSPEKRPSFVDVQAELEKSMSPNNLITSNSSSHSLI